MLKKIYQGFKETKELREDGKIHGKLLFRLYMMLAMVVLAFGFIIYDITIGHLNFQLALICVLVTSILGFLMSKTNKIIWDEKQELLVAGKMDLISVIVLALYIVARVASDIYLNNLYHNSVIVFGISMSILAGFALGRYLGLVFTVRKTFIDR